MITFCSQLPMVMHAAAELGTGAVALHLSWTLVLRMCSLPWWLSWAHRWAVSRSWHRDSNEQQGQLVCRAMPQSMQRCTSVLTAACSWLLPLVSGGHGDGSAPFVAVDCTMQPCSPSLKAASCLRPQNPQKTRAVPFSAVYGALLLLCPEHAR